MSLRETIKHDFWVQITGLRRRQEFFDVLGDDLVPVRTPATVKVDLPGRPGSLAFMLAVEKLPPETQQRLADHLTRKFRVSPPVTPAQLLADGMPILADDCCTIILNPQKWLD